MFMLQGDTGVAVLKVGMFNKRKQAQARIRNFFRGRDDCLEHLKVFGYRDSISAFGYKITAAAAKVLEALNERHA